MCLKTYNIFKIKPNLYGLFIKTFYHIRRQMQKMYWGTFIALFFIGIRKPHLFALCLFSKYSFCGHFQMFNSKHYILNLIQFTFHESMTLNSLTTLWIIISLTYLLCLHQIQSITAYFSCKKLPKQSHSKYLSFINIQQLNICSSHTIKCTI